MKKISFFFSLVFLIFAQSSKASSEPKTFSDVTRQMTEFDRRLATAENLIKAQQEIIASQKQEIEGLKLQIEGAAPKKIPILPLPTAAPPKSLLDGVKFGGDLRLRYEAFSQASDSIRDRNRFLFRLRYGLEKTLGDDFTLGFRLSTGTATDPTGSNQTFTSDFSPKDIFIDRAYALYHPRWAKDHISRLDVFELGGGKMPNPYRDTSSFIFWDQDVNPEGAYEKISLSFADGKFSPFLILGQFIMNENAVLSDSELYAYQAGTKTQLLPNAPGGPWIWTHAISYYDFHDIANSSNFTISGTSLARGNTPLGSTDLAARDFNILGIYQDMGLKAGRVPLNVFGEYFINLNDQTPAPENRNHAFLYGIRLGSAKKRQDWEVKAYYAYIEPNSLLGAISESDFGNGFVNKRGPKLELSYLLTDFLRLGFRAHFVDNVTGSQDEVRRFQTDLEWKF